VRLDQNIYIFKQIALREPKSFIVVSIKLNRLRRNRAEASKSVGLKKNSIKERYYEKGTVHLVGNSLLHATGFSSV
jgi:hypothetical protein